MAVVPVVETEENPRLPDLPVLNPEPMVEVARIFLPVEMEQTAPSSSAGLAHRRVAERASYGPPPPKEAKEGQRGPSPKKPHPFRERPTETDPRTALPKLRPS